MIATLESQQETWLTNEQRLLDVGKLPYGLSAKRADDRRKHRPRVTVPTGGTPWERRSKSGQHRQVRVHADPRECTLRRVGWREPTPVAGTVSPLASLAAWIGIALALPQVPEDTYVKWVRRVGSSWLSAQNHAMVDAADPDRLRAWCAAVRAHPRLVRGVSGRLVRRCALVVCTGELGATNLFTGAISASWNNAGNWSDGIPTADDDVTLTVASPSCTIDVAAVCRSLDCDTYVSTLTHNAAIGLSVGDATSGAGNRALRLVAGMTYTLGNSATSALQFNSTSATQQTVDYGGKTTGNVNFQEAGNWQYVSGHNANGALTTTVTHTRGTLDINGQTCSWGAFASNNSNTRTLTLGAATVTISGTGSAWNVTTTNLTLTAHTATVTMTAGSFSPTTGSNWGGLTLVMTAAGSVSTSVGQVANFTRTGTAAKSDGVTLSTNLTCTGTFTVNGNSAINRVLVSSTARGTTRTVTAATVVASNADLMDITGAGAGSWDLSAITGLSGDCGGNSGITFTPAATQTRSGAGANWEHVANWTSRVPLPQDDVVVAAAASGTITQNMPRMGKSIDFTGFTGTLSFTTAGDVFGSLTIAAAMTWTGASTMTLAGRSVFTITSAGKQISGVVVVNGPGGTYTLQDATDFGRGVSVTNGTLNTNNQTVAYSALTAGGAVTVNGGTLICGTSTFTCLATSSFWVVTSGSVSAASATIVLAAASATTRTFAGFGQTYGTLTYTVAGSTGALTITGANTFGTINFSDANNARTLTLPGATTTTITNMRGFNVNGSAAGNVSVNASAGTATVSSPSLQVCDRLTLTNIAASGGPWFATNSTDGGGNPGWYFGAPGGNGGAQFVLARRRRR